MQNIDNLPLIPNSRIAVKNGAAVFDYFCKRNLIAIDRIIGILHSHQSEYGYDILELLVSSAINLIKLFDILAEGKNILFSNKFNQKRFESGINRNRYKENQPFLWP